jgi:abequosyltransferase
MPREPYIPGNGTPAPPILTIAIPTYKRAGDLEQLLTSLEPQILAHPEVDLYLSDNASPDSTPELVARFQARGMPIRYHRHAENIGSDGNVVSCFESALGKYFWLCGDDEIILPGALDLILSHLDPPDPHNQLDILYLSSYMFEKDHIAEYRPDRLDRQYHTFTSAKRLTFVLNINFTFISSVIINRQRLSELPHEEPAAFLGTNLVQLSWTLPLLRAHRRSRILLKRVIAARWGNSGGYSVGRVFGKNLLEVTTRLLPDRPDLSACILNFAIRRWFPPTILSIRDSGDTSMEIEETHNVLKPLFGRKLSYWLFTYPALKLPLRAAHIWVKLAARLASVADHACNPSFWRRTT